MERPSILGQKHWPWISQRHGDGYEAPSPDWQGAHSNFRIGVYLHDHDSHSGGLSVREGSHLAPDVRSGRTRYLGNQVGDVVAWNLRTPQCYRRRIWPCIPLAVAPRGRSAARVAHM